VTPKTVWLPIFSILFLILVASCFWAFFTSGSVFTALSEIGAMPWGTVTLVDLAVGLGFVMVWMALVQKRKATLILWFIGICCLGNITTLIYLIVRCFKATTTRELFLEKL